MTRRIKNVVPFPISRPSQAEGIAAAEVLTIRRLIRELRAQKRRAAFAVILSGGATPAAHSAEIVPFSGRTAP